ncbi:MAG TPA: hypothetical protein VGR22_06270 [Thermomicrobiales bacterium]|nr:hypothetical protein [Thermomicrobiales bacterium]
MIPATVGAFILDRVKQEIFSTPEEAEQAVEAIEESIIANDDHIGTVYTDADGNEIGQAVRMLNVAIYVVSNERGDPEKDLLAAMRDPESEVIFHTDGGRVSRVIYIPPAKPDYKQTGPVIKGFRADDI